MRIFTPVEVAKPAGSKYLGVLIAAKFARYINEFPHGPALESEKKLTTHALEELTADELAYRLVRQRRPEA